MKERPDGQLTFDFMAVNEEDAGQADTASSKTGSDLEQIKEQEEAVLAHYDIGYGFLGNGLTVWNRLEEEHGDYKTVAHIDADRSVTFYDEGLPEAVKEQIRKVADEHFRHAGGSRIFYTNPGGTGNTGGERYKSVPCGKIYGRVIQGSALHAE